MLLSRLEPGQLGVYGSQVFQRCLLAGVSASDVAYGLAGFLIGQALDQALVGDGGAVQADVGRENNTEKKKTSRKAR